MAWFRRRPSSDKLRTILAQMVEEVVAFAEKTGVPVQLLFLSLRDRPFDFPSFGAFFMKPRNQTRFEELRDSIGRRSKLGELEPLAQQIVREIVDAYPGVAKGATSAPSPPAVAPAPEASSGTAASAPPDAPALRSGLLSAPSIADGPEEAESERGSFFGSGHFFIAPAPPPPAMAPASKSAPPDLSSTDASPKPSPSSKLAARPKDGAPPPELRWFTAGIRDHDGVAPLQVHTDYVLQFAISLAKTGALANAAIPAERILFEDGEPTIELTVQLNSDDFDISEPTMPLVLPRRGPSLGTAAFAVRTRDARRGVIMATLLKEGNFIQQMELHLSVGATMTQPHTSESRGRVIDEATELGPRTIGMSIHPIAGGYDCVAWGTTSNRATLPIEKPELTQYIDNARDQLMAVVMQRGADHSYVFQTGVQIAKADANKAMVTMRDAGALLFQQLFFGPKASLDLQNIGHWLQGQIEKSGVKLQIISEDFPLLWPLLYVGEPNGPVDRECFLGMRIEIEQIPFQSLMDVADPTIASSPPLAVSFNVNADIDGASDDFVKRQRAYWVAASERLRLRLAQRDHRAEFLGALAGSADDQLMYLFCHAVTTGIGASGGITSSYLLLTGGERVTLADLILKAPTTAQLPGHPLVIINACESAELSPMFYNGFVPYFMSKGARGVIGTECKTPAAFAAEWAGRFFPKFLGGMSVGEAMLVTRRDCWEEWNNPLGLLYAVHCNTDTRVHPGLVA
jgi:hypothetical protein